MSADIKPGDRVSWEKGRKRNKRYGIVKRIWFGRSLFDGGTDYAIATIRTDAGGHAERRVENLMLEVAGQEG